MAKYIQSVKNEYSLWEFAKEIMSAYRHVTAGSSL